jgi:hypothetical protein
LDSKYESLLEAVTDIEQEVPEVPPEPLEHVINLYLLDDLEPIVEAPPESFEHVIELGALDSLRQAENGLDHGESNRLKRKRRSSTEPAHIGQESENVVSADH